MPEISEEELQSLNDAKTTLETVNKTLEGVKGEFDTLKTAKVDLERKLDDADKELLSENYLDFKAGKGKPKTGAGDGGNGDDFDFDRASGREIAQHLGAKSKNELATALKGVNDRIGKSEEQIGKALAHLDVTLTALRHKDFDTNKDAIFKVAKSNPTWGAERCYKQWQMEHKASSDKEVADAKAKAEADAKLISEKGEGVPLSTAQDKQLSAEDAASAGYDKAFGTSEKG